VLIDRQTVSSGIVAGVLGGTVIIVLFFVADLVAGTPLRTPAFLSGVLSGQDVEAAGSLRMGVFTVLHYLVFVALGVGAAVLTRITRLPRTPLVGAVGGLFICSLLFYPALVLAGTDVLAAPAWPLVFLGNVLAGMTMIGYLRATASEPGEPALWDELKSNQVLREGLVGGLLGAATVAVWFLIVDSVAGQPLYTPAALGSALLYGSDGAVEVSLATVLGYSLLHVAAFLFLGMVAAALAAQVERFPPLAFGVLILFVVYWTFFIGLVLMFGTWILDDMAWWSLMAGKVLGAIVMGRYLLGAHPRLRAGLSDDALWAES
jgi:hypothetical protein